MALRFTKLFFRFELFYRIVQASMSYARYAFTSTVLQNGSVLVIGGAQLANSDSTWENSQLLGSCELYVNGTWYRTGSLTFPRAGHQVTLHRPLKEIVEFRPITRTVF